MNPKKCQACEQINCRDCIIKWKEQKEGRYCPQCRKTPFRLVELSLYERNKHAEIESSMHEKISLEQSPAFSDACPGACGRRNLTTEKEVAAHLL